MKQRPVITAIVALALLGPLSGDLGSVALAQTKSPDLPPAANPPKLDPKACADHDHTGDTHETQGAAPREELSDKLGRSGGVICPPPGLDPDMNTPPPDGGRTPVIPPPGSPGGDPSVRPK